MTVKELKELLNGFDEEAECVLFNPATQEAEEICEVARCMDGSIYIG